MKSSPLITCPSIRQDNNKIIYFDYNSTTPTDARVLECMLPFYLDKFGNASSNTHTYGWESNLAVKKARKFIAEFLNGNTDNLIFTSGATESNNLVFHAVSQALKNHGNHIITSSIEHKCVLSCCKQLEKQGFDITYIQPDAHGFIQPEHIKSAIRPHTILISIMAANNEIGTIQPIESIGKIASEHKILFHSDAAQLIGKIDFKINDQNIDFISGSAHKMYGPKGIGFLYAKPIKILQDFPLILGGGQERGIRSGTLNVPGIVGFAKACEIAAQELTQESKKLQDLKTLFFLSLKQSIPNIKLNGSLQNSLPGTLNISFPGFSSTHILSLLKNKFAISTGSACTSSSQEYSHVLNALGCTEEESSSSLRISFGKYTTIEELESLKSELIKHVCSINIKQPLN
jgi:cysteine desulfurase